METALASLLDEGAARHGGATQQDRGATLPALMDAAETTGGDHFAACSAAMHGICMCAHRFLVYTGRTGNCDVDFYNWVLHLPCVPFLVCVVVCTGILTCAVLFSFEYSIVACHWFYVFVCVTALADVMSICCESYECYAHAETVATKAGVCIKLQKC